MSSAKVNRNINLVDWKGVWVITEQRFGKTLNVSLELMGEGRKLSNKLNTELTAVVVGSNLDSEVEILSYYGADNVIYIEHDLLNDYNTDAYTKVISELILERKPEAVLVGATTIGRDLAPRVAGRVGTGLTADCTKLDIHEDDNKLLQTRPAFGGNLMATIICPNNRPQMSTVRPGVMEKAVHIDKASKVEKLVPTLGEKDIIARILEIVRKDKDKVSLGDAEIIVAGGRGMGSAEGFALLEELAQKLGGVVGASRAATDAGWIEHSRQIGQTGFTVRPKLYIACGISGAIQHTTGMADSECIISINKDETAPIHGIAHYSIVGDVFRIVPALLQALKEI